MKTIGLVLDIQANKMWLRSRPDFTYSISSDLINVGRIDIPLLSTQLRTIPPFHIAFVQAKTPSFISSEDWQASITGIRRHVVAANSLVRVKNQCCLLQVANCSSKVQVIYPGQYLAVADYFDDDIDEATLLHLTNLMLIIVNHVLPPLLKNYKIRMMISHYYVVTILLVLVLFALQYYRVI
jgi:hypothetical protein